jgi:glycerol-3-phosphate dehydrogenase
VINNNDDLIQKMLRDEFSGDTSKVHHDKKIKFDFTLKTRDEHLKALVDSQFDLLIIGGGANGSGVALDAASRGLKCAVVDAFDFASGTSSRSTKMAHGGVRYFE